MAPTNVLDRFYLSITLLITVGWQLLGFALAWTFQFDKLTDFTGGSNFFILALITLLAGQTFHARNVVVGVFVMVWAARLAGFLLFRVLKRGSDSRFDDIRSHFLKFLAFWIGQIIWVWTVSLPLTILNSPAISVGSDIGFGTAADIVGVILWAVGWIVESVADVQKYYYKSSGWPKDKPLNAGLWGWSRHPPYFGEMLCWWGIWCLSISPATNGHLDASSKGAQYAAIVSPIFTTLLLMFASGVPTAEKPSAKKFFELSYPPQKSGDNPSTDNLNVPDVEGGIQGETVNEPARQPASDAWKNYAEYRAQTSILIPLPPAIYRPLPKWIKRTILLDWPMYEYVPGRD